MKITKDYLRTACFILLCFTLLLVGCREKDANWMLNAPLTITGDVENEVVLTNYNGWKTEKIKYREETQEVIALAPILDAARMTGEDITLLFSSPDGAVAEIPLAEILKEECWLRLSGEYGWQFISHRHPRQAGIKFMDRITVAASRPGPKTNCVRLIDGVLETALTYGQLFAAEGTQLLVLEGEAKKDELTTTVYSQRTLIPISSYLTPESRENKKAALAYYHDGSQGEISLAGFFEWRGNSADYIGADGKSRKPDIIGVWVDPPSLCVTDLAKEALSALATDRVLIVLLDGLSYYDLLQLKPAFLTSKEVQRCRTVMPSITPVGLAAVLTGKLPSENGVTARNKRELAVDDIFAAATKMGKSSAMVNGATKIINTSIEQFLNPDLNEQNGTDDEVFACAQEQLEAGVELIFVHFKGYDDIAHRYGPLTPQAAAKLEDLDTYVARLCSEFSGQVFVIADHGQHSASGERLGEHGEFRLPDLTVPWIQFTGENEK